MAKRAFRQGDPLEHGKIYDPVSIPGEWSVKDKKKGRKIKFRMLSYDGDGWALQRKDGNKWSSKVLDFETSSWFTAKPYWKPTCQVSREAASFVYHAIREHGTNVREIPGRCRRKS